MTEFKVGDRVMCLIDKSNKYSKIILKKGMKGTIIEMTQCSPGGKVCTDCGETHKKIKWDNSIEFFSYCYGYEIYGLKKINNNTLRGLLE